MQYRFKRSNLFLIVFFLSTISFAQQNPTGPHDIHPMDLEIACDQTSVLFFPAAIKSVDRGSRNILSKTVKDVSNVLKLKAASDSMKPSNLHVFTADGQAYAFNVKYQPQPQYLTIDLSNTRSWQEGRSPLQFTAGRLNDAEVERYAELIAALKPIRSVPRSQKMGNARLAIQGAYYVKGVIFFQLSLVNNAPIPYRIDFTRTYIRDKRRSKRTSLMEKEIPPLFSKVQDSHKENSNQHLILVLAFDQFTIADNKRFVIEVFEKSGDRGLTCKLNGKDILKAKRLLEATPNASTVHNE